MNEFPPSDSLDRVLAERDLRAIFEFLARRHGGVEALAAPGRAPLHFAALPACLGAVKAALNRRGIGRGDVVVVAAPNGPDLAACIVATAACATVAPLNATYTADEYHRYLQPLQPKAVIALRGHPSAIRAAAIARGIAVLEIVVDPAAPAGIFELEGAATAPCRDAHWNGRDDVAVLLHTSGTSAQQKLIPMRTRHVLASACDMRRTFALGPGDRSLHVMPMFHGHGLRAALLQPLLAGSTVVCLPHFSPDDFLAELRAHRATWYSAGFTIHKAVGEILRDRPEAAQGIRLRFIRSGSGRLEPAVIATLEAAFATVVIERYGQSETGTVAINPMPPGRRKPGSVGLPEGCEIVIRSVTDFAPVPAGGEGEVTVRGPGVFEGYLNDPEATAAAFVDGWLRTGDLGRFDADGHLTITGRIKDMINRGGEKVSPTEVEAALARHPALRAVCVFATPHPRLGEDIAAAVIAVDGATVGEDDILAFAAETLSDFKVPRRIHFVAKFALGPTHKIDRRAVARECLAAESVEEVLPAPTPHDAVRVRLEPLWRAVLGLESVPATRDFFMLGGDSLSATQLLALVARAFGVELPLRAVFREARTLARMAATIAALTAGDAAHARAAHHRHAVIARRPRDARIPLSFAQEQIWLHDRLQPESTAYNINRIVRVRGDLDVDALARSLTLLVARHEVLRTTIVVTDGVPQQIVHEPAGMELPVVDLTDRAGASVEAELRRIANEESRQPIDLAVGPLFRARLYRFAATDHLLVLVVHHIVVDGDAIRSLTGELAAFYAEASTDGADFPPPLAVSFADFALWDRAMHDRGAFGAQLEFWRRELAGASELDLPTDHARPRKPVMPGLRLRHPLGRIDVAQLRLLGRSEGSSLFGVLIAAVDVLLHRYTGATDIVIGTPFSRRSHPELRGVIGPLFNVLPLRVDLSGDPSFRHMLRRVATRILANLDHADAPLTRILEATGMRRQPNRHPLFQVVAVFAPEEIWSFSLPGTATEMVAIDDGPARYDLLLQFIEKTDGIDLVIQYDRELFDATTMARLAGHLECLLESIGDAPDARLSELRVMPAAERRLLLEEWSGAAASRPVSGSIASLFAAQARARGDALAAVCGDRQTSYAELDSWSTRLAHRLRAAGIGPDVVVAIAAVRTPALLAALLGILKAGGAYLPLDPQLPTSRLAFMVRDAGAVLVLTGDDRLARLGIPVMPLDPTGADLDSAPTTAIADGAGPETLAYVMYTSGSTGTPKGVAVPHRGVIRLVRETGYAEFGPAQRMLQLAPVAFDASSFEIWGALLNGGCLVQIATERPTLSEIGGVIASGRVSTLWLTAGLFHQMVDHALASFAGVHQVLAGGDVLSTSHAARFRAAHPQCRLINGYGPTEGTTFSCTHPIAADAAPAPSVPIGRPIANTQAYVLDPLLRLVPVGATGELCVGGAGLARGYVNRPELTASRFVASPFDEGRILYRTGDRVRWRSDGTLQFLGRLDRQVKLRGYRIEPAEIEAALQAHAAVREAAVALRRDAAGEARLVAFCTFDAAANAPDETALRAFLRERLPGYMIPAAFVALPALPLTAQGKVDLKALPEVEIGRSGASEFIAARTPFESALAGIWRDILGVERIGATDDFFDLGGHSLLAAKMLFRVQEHFGVELPLSSVFEESTIEAMALTLVERMAALDAATAAK